MSEAHKVRPQESIGPDDPGSDYQRIVDKGAAAAADAKKLYAMAGHVLAVAKTLERQAEAYKGKGLFFAIEYLKELIGKASVEKAAARLHAVVNESVAEHTDVANTTTLAFDLVDGRGEFLNNVEGISPEDLSNLIGYLDSQRKLHPYRTVKDEQGEMAFGVLNCKICTAQGLDERPAFCISLPNTFIGQYRRRQLDAAAGGHSREWDEQEPPSSRENLLTAPFLTVGEQIPRAPLATGEQIPIAVRATRAAIQSGATSPQGSLVDVTDIDALVELWKQIAKST